MRFSFSHVRVQHTMLDLGAWSGATLSFSHLRAQHTVLDLGAWPGAALAGTRSLPREMAGRVAKFQLYKGGSFQISFTTYSRDF